MKVATTTAMTEETFKELDQALRDAAARLKSKLKISTLLDNPFKEEFKKNRWEGHKRTIQNTQRLSQPSRSSNPFANTGPKHTGGALSDYIRAVHAALEYFYDNQDNVELSAVGFLKGHIQTITEKTSNSALEPLSQQNKSTKIFDESLGAPLLRTTVSSDPTLKRIFQSQVFKDLSNHANGRPDTSPNCLTACFTLFGCLSEPTINPGIQITAKNFITEMKQAKTTEALTTLLVDHKDNIGNFNNRDDFIQNSESSWVYKTTIDYLDDFVNYALNELGFKEKNRVY